MLEIYTDDELQQTVPQIWADMTTGSGPFAAMFTEDNAALRCYSLDPWEDKAKEGEFRVALNTPQAAVDLAAHLVAQNPPLFNVHYEGESQTSKRKAQMQENFIIGSLKRNEVERGDATYERSAHSLALFGRSVVRVLYLDDKHRGSAVNFPFWIECFDPRNVVYELAGAAVDWVVMHDPAKRVSEIASIFGDDVWEALDVPRAYNATVPWYEAWDNKARVYVAQGNNQRRWGNKSDHGYGCNPWAISQSSAMVINDPAWRSVSFTRAIQDEWKAQCRVASMILTFVNETVRNLKFVKTRPGRDINIEDYVRGGWIKLSQDEDIGHVPLPPLPAAANQLVELFQADMDRATFTSVMYGGGAMPSSARLASVLRAGNEASLSPLVHAQQRLFTDRKSVG
jgi:hypothetical protein